MSAENDYSVRKSGEGREIWGVVPVSDRSSNGRGRGGKKRILRKKKQDGKRPAAETPPAKPDGEDESEDGSEPTDGEPKVDHLA